MCSRDRSNADRRTSITICKGFVLRSRLYMSVRDTTRSRGTHRWAKWLLALGGGFALCGVVATLLVSPVDGYESSMYAAYPVWIWGLLLGALLVAQAVIFREAMRETPDSTTWGLGFALGLLVVAVLLFIPILRGYPVYGRADLLTHIGQVSIIDRTGGTPFQNIYQNLHQLMLAFAYASGLPPMAIVNAVAAILSLFSLLATATLLSVLFDRRRFLLSLPFALVLFGGGTHLNPSPYAQSVMLLPFVLYLFLRAQQTEALAFRLPLTVTLIAAILFHPLTALFLLLIFSIHYVVVSRSGGSVLSRAVPVSRVTATSVVQLTIVIFMAWYYNFVGIILRFETVFRRLLRPSQSETELDTYGQTITEFSPSVADIARVLTFRYGQRAFLAGIGTLFVVIALWRYLDGKRFETPYLTTFSMSFVAFVALGVLFLVVDLIGGFGRPLTIAQLFVVLTAGTFVAYLYDQFDRPTAVTTLVLVTFVILGSLTLITLYSSPMAGDTTSQVTQHELEGTEWYLANDLQTEPLQEYGTSLYRFEHALEGSDTSVIPQGGTAPPDRFNYTRHSTLGASYEEDQYLVVTEQGRQFYPTTYPGYDDEWRFQAADFERLTTDPTVSHVYGNGEFDVYLVEATGGF